MKSYGHINLQQNQIQQAAFEVETNFPETPVVGRIVFKDKRLYICAEVVTGVAAWIPLTNEINSYIHTEVSASSTWTVVHGLDTTSPIVQVYDANGQTMVIPDAINIIDNNQVTIDLGAVMAGRAVVMLGVFSGDGLDRPVSSYEHTQTVLSDTWTINHDLGYYPEVRVFTGEVEILPDSITHPDLFTTIITFTEAKTGIARVA